jgi:hypothetical protein
MRWVGHTAYIRDKRGENKVFVGIPDGKRPLGRPRRREDIKWIFKTWNGEEWPGLFWFWIRPGGGRLWMQY